jgi:hypothetical protein
MTDPSKSRPEIYRERAARMLRMADEAPNANLRRTYLWLSDDFNRRYFQEQASRVRDLIERTELDSVRALYRDMLAKLERMADEAFHARAGTLAAPANDVVILLRETLTI